VGNPGASRRQAIDFDEQRAADFWWAGGDLRRADCVADCGGGDGVRGPGGEFEGEGMTQMKISAPLPWYGGKRTQASQIIEAIGPGELTHGHAQLAPRPAT